MGKIKDYLAKIQGQKVYFDTNVIIYILNNEAPFSHACLPFFEAVENGDIVGCTGEIGLSELLVRPMQTNDLFGIDYVKSLFDERGYFELLPHTREMFELSAYIRATQKLKTVDAVHAATAIKNGCHFMLTHDEKIAKNVKGLNIINIKDFLV
jgi:predicted nucleic acid-binding protein